MTFVTFIKFTLYFTLIIIKVVTNVTHVTRKIEGNFNYYQCKIQCKFDECNKCHVLPNLTHVTRKNEGVTKRGKRRKRRSQSSRMF